MTERIDAHFYFVQYPNALTTKMLHRSNSSRRTRKDAAICC